VKTLLLSTLLFYSTLQAISLEEIISSSLSKSPSLEVIQARIQANKQSIDVANQFTNPELSLTKNTLDSSQAMSQTVLSVKQKIQYYDKRDTKQSVSIAQDALLREQLKFAQVALVAKIKTEAYTIWELRELKNIIDSYIVLTKRNIELYESYTTVDANQHMGIMKAELSLANLDIQKSTLDAQIYAAYARLSYLAAVKVDTLDIALTIHNKPDLIRLQKTLIDNPTIAIKDKEIQKQHANVAVADMNNYPDLNLVAGYAYRENYDNYMNFGLALTLPIYGTEDALTEEARAMELSYIKQKQDSLIAINATLEAYFAQMLSAYNIYHIVQDDALPQIAHMFELSNSSISTGGDLFKYIDVLFDKLALEQKSISAVANYKKAEAKISELSGALQ